MTQQPVGIIGEGEKLAVIAICNLTSISNKAYATHLQFAYRLAKDNPEYQFLLFTPYRMSIAPFRDSAATIACEANAEYLMFIDDDAILLNNASIFKQLKYKLHGYDDRHIVMPVTRVRGYPFQPMFFKWIEPDENGKRIDFYTDFKEQKVTDDNMLEVAAIGCHTCLIKTEVFYALDKPYFLTGTNHTEDVYFCLKCRDYIENIGIYVATDISVGHLLDPIWVDETNVKLLSEFYEKMNLNNQFNVADYFEQPKQIQRDLDSIGESLEE